MSKLKMKKAMLVVGMATALNLGMGLMNGAWAMINEENENNETHKKSISELLYDHAYSGSFNKEKLTSLLSASNEVDFITTSNSNKKDIIVDCINLIKNKKYLCSHELANNFLKTLTILYDEFEELKGHHQTLLTQLAEDISDELMY